WRGFAATARAERRRADHAAFSSEGGCRQYAGFFQRRDRHYAGQEIAGSSCVSEGMGGDAEWLGGLCEGGGDSGRRRYRGPVLEDDGKHSGAGALCDRRSRGCDWLAGRIQLPVGLVQRLGRGRGGLIASLSGSEQCRCTFPWANTKHRSTDAPPSLIRIDSR